jgi:dTDP-4-dehydrorhamnose reductase
MLYVSTDYVFPGTDPPYTEESAAEPVNVYGHSKLAGEEHTLCVPGGLVVRIPALYSLDLAAPNNLLGALESSLAEGSAVQAEDERVRYYTLAEDVAAACAFLMQREHYGVVHFSAQASTTKYEFLSEAAGALGCDARLVQRVPAGENLAPRPQDCHLDTSIYQSLGGPEARPWPRALSSLATGCAAEPQI